MRRWTVGAQGSPPVWVEANSWLTALGLGLEQLGRCDGIERLACEVLRNGTVIARDISSSSTFLVQPAQATVVDDDDFLEEAIEVTGEADRSALIPDAADVRTACKAALDSARDAIGSESGAVLLVRGERLVFAVAYGPDSAGLTELSVPIGQGIAGYSIEQERIVILNSAKDDPRHYGGIDAALDAETRALAAFPIFDGGKVLGAIELVNLPEGQRFSRAAVHHVHELTKKLGKRLVQLGE